MKNILNVSKYMYKKSKDFQISRYIIHITKKELVILY